MRVIRDTMLLGSSANNIREPDAEQEVYRFAMALNQSNPAPPYRRGGVADVPSYVIGRANERRSYERVRLSLPLRVERIAGQRPMNARTLQTQDISSSGVYFLSPHRIEPGTPIELELLVVDRPLGPGSVRMRAEAHVIRTAHAARGDWQSVAAAFDDIRFFRDDQLPRRFKAG